MNSCIIITDAHRIGGMATVAHKMGGEVTAVAVGSRDLANTAAATEFDKVLCIEVGEGFPAEAYAPQLAQLVKANAPELVMSTDSAVSRSLLAAVAGELNAAVITSVRDVAVEGNTVTVTRAAIQGKVLEDLDVRGHIAAIFDGDDEEAPAKKPVTVKMLPVSEPDSCLKLVEIVQGESSGLLTAARVVSVGRGVMRRDDVSMIEELAQAMHAELGCSLPVCDDKNWFPPERVVGVSHNQIAPELYIAVGVSGSAQHMSGVRDAKIIVAINNDPEAAIFEKCNYGILGDLYKICPALTAAYKARE